MQDTQSGALVAIDDESQEAKDRAIPQRDRQGPTFAIGEVVDLKGGKFRVHAISDKRLYLDSIPSRGT